MPFLDNNDTVKYGKYSGDSIQKIINSDPQYCNSLRAELWGYTDARLMNILNADPTIKKMLVFGKYAGRNIQEINEIDPEYVSRLEKNKFIMEQCPMICEQL